MESFNANDAAFTLMSEASDGKDISNRYNSLTPQEQKDVFGKMTDMQSSKDTMKLFGNLELFDNNKDGVMDDAKSFQRDGSIKDVYNHERVSIERGAAGGEKGPEGPGRQGQSPEAKEEFRPLTQREISRDPFLQQADMMLRQASHGQDIHNRYSNFANNPRMLEAMRHVQASKPEFSNVNLIDANGDGIMDDARALVNGRNGQAEVDVYKTAGDRVQEKATKQADGALRRGGEIIVDEVFRGIRNPNSRGPSAGERVLDRMGREGTNGTQRVLRDILRGR